MTPPIAAHGHKFIFLPLLFSRRWWFSAATSSSHSGFWLSSSVGSESWYFPMLFNHVLLVPYPAGSNSELPECQGTVPPLPRCFPSPFIALIFARYTCRKGGGGPCPAEEPKPWAFTRSRWHFVFAAWPSHRGCVCLILTSALGRKWWWAGRGKQSQLVLLEAGEGLCFSQGTPGSAALSGCWQVGSLSCENKLQMNQILPSKVEWDEGSTLCLGVFLLL